LQISRTRISRNSCAHHATPYIHTCADMPAYLVATASRVSLGTGAGIGIPAERIIGCRWSIRERSENRWRRCRERRRPIGRTCVVSAKVYKGYRLLCEMRRGMITGWVGCFRVLLYYLQRYARSLRSLAVCHNVRNERECQNYSNYDIIGLAG